MSKGQTKSFTWEKVGRQHKGMDRTGVWGLIKGYGNLSTVERYY